MLIVTYTADEFSEHTAQRGEVVALQRLSAGSERHPAHSRVPPLIHTFWVQSRYGNHLCIVSELLSLNIHSIASMWWAARIFVPEYVLKRIVRDVLLALDYCHQECGIIHTGAMCISSRERRRSG